LFFAWNGRLFNYGCTITIRRSYRFVAVFWGNPFIVCELFPKWNIETTYFDINNPDIIESCKNLIQRFFAESPTNPAVDIIDLELLGAIAKSTI
jgi:cystathionine beta-lyase/cystathionine gamma-synthase